MSALPKPRVFMLRRSDGRCDWYCRRIVRGIPLDMVVGFGVDPRYAYLDWLRQMRGR